MTLILNCAIAHTAEPSPAKALAKAREYLWSQQHDDGSWQSEQYAVMRSGQALTPFVLHALIHEIDIHDVEKTQLAVNFILDHLDAAGAIGKADPDILEYPVYSTAYGVMALNRWNTFSKTLYPEEEIRKESVACRKMAQFLRAAQFNDSTGFTPKSLAYGGWGFDKPQSPGESGHMDLAHSRRAMAAVHLMGNLRNAEDALIHAHLQRFLAVVQKRPETLDIQPVPEGVARPKKIPFDGGFYFSPVVLQANKGRLEKDGNYWRSYATATCDGILALLAAGVPKDDERVTAAAKWLREHTNLEYPQGIPTDFPEPWGDALKYYHFAVRAEVYDALDFPAEEKQALAEKVAALQQPAGSFVNSASPLMKEDEPLLATALAVVALTHCSD